MQPNRNTEQVSDPPKDAPPPELLAAQLTRASEDWRQLDQYIWQVPTVAVTVASIVLAVAVTYIKNHTVSGVVLIVGAFFEFTMAIALTKYRLMEDGRSVYLRNFEKMFGLPVIPVQTGEVNESLPTNHEHQTPRWFRERNAFLWLFGSLIAFALGLAILGVIEIVFQYSVS